MRRGKGTGQSGGAVRLVPGRAAGPEHAGKTLHERAEADAEGSHYPQRVRARAAPPRRRTRRRRARRGRACASLSTRPSAVFVAAGVIRRPVFSRRRRSTVPRRAVYLHQSIPPRVLRHSPRRQRAAGARRQRFGCVRRLQRISWTSSRQQRAWRNILTTSSLCGRQCGGSVQCD